MSDTKTSENPISLYELCNGLRRYIERRIQGKFLWVSAEIAQINEKKHAYLQLTETKGDTTIASMQAVIWSRRLEEIRQNLGSDASSILKQGAKVLFQVQVEYHEVYGLKLVIQDIDPTYSLGELEKKKQETIQQLTELGLMNQNSSMSIPRVAMRIGLVASPGTSGYADFMQHLEGNEFGYRFFVRTFPSSVQGDQAEAEIAARLAETAEYDLDLIVLIRGGGSKFDLEVFNAFSIAKTIAELQLPVITGIGHETDVTVADMVAHTRLKTPTAAAQFLIQRAMAFEAEMIDMSNRIVREAKNVLEIKKLQTSEAAIGLKHAIQNIVSDNKNALNVTKWVLEHSPQKLLQKHQSHLARQTSAIREKSIGLLNGQDKQLGLMSAHLSNRASRRIESELQRLNGLGKVVELLRPENTLARGYSITTKKGKIVQTGDTLAQGDLLEIQTTAGVVEGTVNKFAPHDKN